MPVSKLKAAEAKKLEADRLQGFLQELLREEENKYCADCEQKAPRWASWNLGVFLCIRCAGLHRNLGVHISKVKSVTLDSWTQEQVQSMRVMGNAKARAVYESELPQLFRRPQTDQTLEQFIRAKYEAKRYIMKGWVPPNIDVSDLPALPEAMGQEKKAHTTDKYIPNSNRHHNILDAGQEKKQQHNPLGSEKMQNIVHQLIDLDMGTVQSNNKTHSADEQNKLDSMDDLFGPIVSAVPSIPSSLLSASNISTSVSSPNLSNSTDANLLSDIFGTDNSSSATVQSSGIFPHDFSHMMSNSSAAIQAQFQSNHQQQQIPTTNNSNLIDSSVDFSFFSSTSAANQSARPSPSSDSIISSPPSKTDTKKSTNEIMALFNK